MEHSLRLSVIHTGGDGTQPDIPLHKRHTHKGPGETHAKCIYSVIAIFRGVCISIFIAGGSACLN